LDIEQFPLFWICCSDILDTVTFPILVIQNSTIPADHDAALLAEERHRLVKVFRTSAGFLRSGFLERILELTDIEVSL
jgi:hypothetical protein